jgi:hypothetical protein
MNKLRVAFIAACVGVGLTIIASVANIIGCGDWTSGISIASTGISIALSLFSIIYTYISGQKTMDNLEKFESDYQRLVELIKILLSASNRDDANIANARRALEEFSKS